MLTTKLGERETDRKSYVTTVIKYTQRHKIFSPTPPASYSYSKLTPDRSILASVSLDSHATAISVRWAARAILILA